MKNFFPTLIVILFSAIFIFGQKCVEPTNKSSERRVCSHMEVTIDEVVTSQIKGIVLDANNDPVLESIIEIYESKENGKLVAVYKTGDDGKFCIKKLPKGKYSLKVGWSRFGFNCTNLEVEIKGNKKKLIKVPLQVGT